MQFDAMLAVCLIDPSVSLTLEKLYLASENRIVYCYQLSSLASGK
jgi:hypothetical protein